MRRCSMIQKQKAGVPNAETYNIENTVKRYKEAGVKGTN